MTGQEAEEVRETMSWSLCCVFNGAKQVGWVDSCVVRTSRECPSLWKLINEGTGIWSMAWLVSTWMSGYWELTNRQRNIPCRAIKVPDVNMSDTETRELGYCRTLPTCHKDWGYQLLQALQERSTGSSDVSAASWAWDAMNPIARTARSDQSPVLFPVWIEGPCFQIILSVMTSHKVNLQSRVWNLMFIYHSMNLKGAEACRPGVFIGESLNIRITYTQKCLCPLIPLGSSMMGAVVPSFTGQQDSSDFLYPIQDMYELLIPLVLEAWIIPE